MKNLRIKLLIGLCGCLGIANGTDLLIEAESFTDKGGWVVDQQFMDQMGSSYLLAHGIGNKVADASTKIVFPTTGIYHVYVRTYNWTSPWKAGKGAGQFALIVEGKSINDNLGTEGDSWIWQKAGQVQIDKPENKIILRDLSGFDGRCDALYFTTDPSNLPPTGGADLETFRREKLELPDEVPIAGEYDFVVVGAGIAGMCAAVSAARLGCKVALINDRPVVGGNNSSEIRVHLGGRIEVGPYKNLGNLQKEFSPSRGGNAQPAQYYEDDKKMNWLKQEKNVELFTNYRVVRLDKKENRIVSVVAKHIESGKELRFKAPLFSDCTGDGTIGYLAGADYRMGREARKEFGESLAPEQADKMTMGSSIQWYSIEEEKPSTFPPFDYGLTFNDTICEQVTMGEWTWETGMDRDPISDAEQIRDYGMLVVYSNWSFLKNSPSTREKYARRRLDWVAYVAGKRESRRLLGDYILKEDDIKKNVAHEDASFTTSWSIDLHRKEKKNSLHFPGREFKAETTHIYIYPYAVPYRCLYSRNIDNLFMAGRNISVTHVALGTVRVMRTTGMMGEVVGMAASLCKQYGIYPREVYRLHLDELKHLMEKGTGNPELPNNQLYNRGDILQEKPTIK